MLMVTYKTLLQAKSEINRKGKLVLLNDLLKFLVLTMMLFVDPVNLDTTNANSLVFCVISF